ncbi:DUF397 domain-containing protein [Actinomadura craniellae]|uniref:DUF397 domain-containing protein n=1 Tax=Actinomadura craniellae TaxID=2231787 RepID=A0A365HEJ2_9ACTN|nr:DUF397 domain-containing protein [Actinomadura craniellae]RAY17296.1 DUF397 domain-containing protein [Actinomadura craniellae]
MDLSKAVWRKSSRSQGGGTECVEVAAGGTLHAVRDSKDPQGDILIMDASAWRDLLDRVRAGTYDLHP